LYGYSALMAETPGVYDPVQDGRFSAVYNDCRLPDEAQTLRIHGFAPDEATVNVYIDDVRAGGISCNTRDYEKKPSEARNHMPRAVMAEKARRDSLPLLWTDIMIPLDLNFMADRGAGTGHSIRIEAAGPFKYDWFTMV
ncbi:MAG: hypothetical protein ILP17_00075, partial [Lachnospiraceae bacterium]|nr:hypothetical protein [Lachnospiraceae bacterium]